MRINMLKFYINGMKNQLFFLVLLQTLLLEENLYNYGLRNQKMR